VVRDLGRNWMRVPSRITWLWPGLNRLWWRGEPAALAVAVAFAILLNLVIWASVDRSTTVPQAWVWVGWLVCLIFWGAGIWSAGRYDEKQTQRNAAQAQQDLLNRAQAEYLRGSWSEAQAILERQIRHNPDDVEAHLLLSSVFRRSGRVEQSRRRLEHASRLEGADRWRLEIQRERTFLDRRQQSMEESVSEGA
jgi:cytochrome c-type biogenesis protein CcmH/NrfG